MKLPRWLLYVLVCVALFLLVGRALAGVYVDYRWYAALGAEAVWRERTMLALALRLASTLVGSVFVFANVYAVRHSVVSFVLPRRVGNIEIGEEVPSRYLVGAAAAISLLVGAALALPSDSWETVALARHGVPFGETDTYFVTDLGFFVYWLPLERMLYVWALIAVLVVTALVVFLYALTPSLRVERGTVYVSRYVRRHVVVLGCLMLLVLAWSFRLDAFAAMIRGSGPEGAFTFTDSRAVIPVNLWLSILTGAAALVVLFFGWTGQVRVAFVAVSAVLVLSFGLRQLAPAVARRAADTPDPAARERPYQQIRAEYTRRAYALDRIARGDSLAFRAAGEALAAVSVWDPVALTRALLRERRVEGAPQGVSWASSEGGLLALVLDGPAHTAPLEERHPSAAPWRIVRVHAAASDPAGSPVVLGPATTGAGEAMLPPVLVADSISGYTLVADTTGRVAAPDLGSTLSRVAHAWRLQNFHLLSAELARTDLRVLTRRNVQERVTALVPFFVQGSAPVPVVAVDSLYWTVDLYATSATYPLSEHVSLDGREYSYIHHAATAIVNAHTGRVRLLPDPAPDPIARSWLQLFPSLFGVDGLPGRVLAALPPARDGMRIQALEFARYGPRGTPASMGRLPWNLGADSALRTDPPPLALIPDGRLAWSEAVLDSTNRVAGIIVGTGVGSAPASTYWIPVRRPEARWNTLVDELHRAIDSAAGPSRDARLVHGVTRVVAVAGRLLLIQPAYTWRPDAPPTLARVGVSQDGTITTGHTLAEALGVLGGPAFGDTATLGPRDFRTLVAQLYDAMQAALQRGDWAAFGRAYDQLGKLVTRGRE